VRDSDKVVDEVSYLKSIKLLPRVIQIDNSNISRAAQLCAKTNQYNLRTARHTESAIESLLAEDAKNGFLVHLTDIYGDHGIVGMVLIRNVITDYCFLDTFLMSCRVLGRHLDAWMLKQAVEMALSKGAKYLVAEFKETAKNKIAKSFLSQHGFKSCNIDKIDLPGDFQLIGENLFILNLDSIRIPYMEIYE